MLKQVQVNRLLRCRPHFAFDLFRRLFCAYTALLSARRNAWDAAGLECWCGQLSTLFTVQHAPILERQEPFPVMIFSHGIGGTRNAYSGICSELGSAVGPPSLSCSKCPCRVPRRTRVLATGILVFLYMSMSEWSAPLTGGVVIYLRYIGRVIAAESKPVVLKDAVVCQGFVVLAVEHADGTAATVQLAGQQGARFYGGWLSEEERLAQTRCLSSTAPRSCLG